MVDVVVEMDDIIDREAADMALDEIERDKLTKMRIARRAMCANMKSAWCMRSRRRVSEDRSKLWDRQARAPWGLVRNSADATRKRATLDNVGL
jgi:hypothetical protein